MFNSTQPDHLSESDLGRAQKDLKMLYEISSAMRSTLELESILYIILTGVTAHYGLGFNRAILFLVSPQGRNLEPKVAIGPESLEHAQNIWSYITNQNHHLDDLINEGSIGEKKQSFLFQSIKELKIPLSTDKDNILANVYHTGNSIHINRNQIFQYEHDPLLKVFKTNELVVMPLKAKDKVNGVIVADNLFTQNPITQQNLTMFHMLSNQAGLAIENSQLYEKIKHKSNTDSLTELYNHGYFQDKLNDEFIKAETKKQQLSLLLIDIDNFKKLNDQYGHQAGDYTIKRIANILKTSSRESDYVCRYGGEEYAIILPATDKEHAYVIAERIRKNIESYNFKELSSHNMLTVSIGLANFPDDASTKNELIALTDKALYIAKFSGKNRTCVHEPPA